MKRIILLSVSVVLLVSLGACAAAQPQTQTTGGDTLKTGTTSEGTSFAEGRILVCFESSIDVARAREIIAEQHWTLQGDLSEDGLAIGEYYLMELPENTDTQEAARAASGIQGVFAAQLDYAYQLQG